MFHSITDLTFFREIQNGHAPATAEESFRGFAKYLGRVVSYRALSLTAPQFETIKNADSIWPSGR